MWRAFSCKSPDCAASNPNNRLQQHESESMADRTPVKQGGESERSLRRKKADLRVSASIGGDVPFTEMLRDCACPGSCTTYPERGRPEPKLIGPAGATTELSSMAQPKPNQPK